MRFIRSYVWLPLGIAVVACASDESDAPSPNDAGSTFTDGGGGDDAQVVDAGDASGDASGDAETADGGGADSGDDGGPPTCSVAGKIPASCPDYAAYSTFTVEAAGPSSPVAATPCTAGDTIVNVGQSLATAVSSAAAGATICLKSGIHRATQTAVPKAGQTIRGEAGAILRGSIDITSGWTASGAVFTKHVVLPNTPTQTMPAGLTCEDDVNNPCIYAEDIFVNGTQPKRVGTAGAVTAGSYYVAYPGGNAIDITLGALGTTIEVASTPSAINMNQADVTVANLVVEQFASPANNGAIIVNANATNAKIHDMEIRNNHASGIKHYAAGSLITNNHSHHNGQMGIFTSGGDGSTFNHNELDHNNIDWFLTTDGAAGGIKISSDNVTVNFNKVHDNYNRGIWVDVGATTITIAGNLVENNYSNGIMYEISSAANIHHNTVIGNALKNPDGRQNPGCTSVACGAGIVLNNVNGGCVYANTVQGNLNGVSLIEKYRTAGTPVNRTRNVTVYDNQIALDSPKNLAGVGLSLNPSGADPTSDPYAAASLNVFYRNRYTQTSVVGKQFLWDRVLGTKQTWTTTNMQDACGTFL